jgi:hopanoid biosynthesis associated protein HpnK
LRGLIITADDFGAAVEVNEAVELAHRSGVLTAASLMASGAAAADAIERARRMPGLRVGLHVVLVEGRPVLPVSAVSRLVDHSGRSGTGMTALGALLALSGRARRQAAAEIAAQFAVFLAGGLRLDHCNAHKHFHLHPVIGGLIAEIGSRFGLRSVRVPLESPPVLRKVERGSPGADSWLPAVFARRLARRLRRDGFLVPDHVFGLRWSGQMTAARLGGLIRHLPDGLSEIYLHPATGSFGGAAPGYRYREELDALLSADVAAACRGSSLRLGGFGDFLAPEPELAPVRA